MSAELERVREYRLAARYAVRAKVDDVRKQYLALIDLAETARREPDLVVRRWGEAAIWEESRVFLGVDDEEPQAPPESYEHAQRRLRLEGYSTCPSCKSELATDDDFERWRRMRVAHIEYLERRERAIDQ